MTLNDALETLPDYMRSHVKDYVLEGAPIGDFLTAVFSNKFAQACAYADGTNQRYLHAYALFLFNHVPTIAWGNGDKVDHWQAIGGLKGYQASKKENPSDR